MYVPDEWWERYRSDDWRWRRWRWWRWKLEWRWRGWDDGEYIWFLNYRFQASYHSPDVAIEYRYLAVQIKPPELVSTRFAHGDVPVRVLFQHLHSYGVKFWVRSFQQMYQFVQHDADA